MGWVSDLLREFPALSVAKERLSLLEDRLKQSEGECEKLRAENEMLAGKVASLEARLSEADKGSKFVEDSGVLWKRDASGRFPPICYCPKCLLAMSVVDPMLDLPPRCSQCKFKAPFERSHIQEIANRLNG